MEPGMNEKLGPDDGDVELTLESLNRKIESIVEAQNKMYNVIVKATDEKFLLEDERNKEKDMQISHGFTMLNTAITGFAARLDILADELVEKVKTDKEDLIKRSIARAEEILLQQQELMEAEMKKQEEAMKKKKVKK